jgi:hypothetical protein
VLAKLNKGIKMLKAGTGFSSIFRTGGSDFSSELSRIEADFDKALQANEKRYEQAMAIYDAVIETYSPGGSFGKAALSQLSAQKERDVGAETQAGISGGLFGTTAVSGLGAKWESTTGAPARLKLEDIMMQRLTGAQMQKAGFIERREDEYPDVNALSSLIAQGGGGGTVSGGTDISSYMRRFNESRSSSGGTGSAPGAAGGGAGSNGGWSGGASATLTFGPEGGGEAHQATPGFGLGGEQNPYTQKPVPEGYEIRKGTILGMNKSDPMWAGQGQYYARINR